MKLDDDMRRYESDVDLTCQNGNCTGRAFFIVRIHPIDHCNRPRLDVNHDCVYTMCPKCMKEIGDRIADIFRTTPVTGTCRTCGRRVEKLHDVYQVESLVRP